MELNDFKQGFVTNFIRYGKSDAGTVDNDFLKNEAEGLFDAIKGGKVATKFFKIISVGDGENKKKLNLANVAKKTIRDMVIEYINKDPKNQIDTILNPLRDCGIINSIENYKQQLIFKDGIETNQPIKIRTVYNGLVVMVSEVPMAFRDNKLIFQIKNERSQSILIAL